MTEEKTKVKKFIQNGVIRFQRVEITAEDIIEERDNEIKNLKSLVDSLRTRIEQLEQEQQRQKETEAAAAASTYDCYK